MNESIFAFNSLAEFWAMGKHGPYVWSCFALTMMVLGLNVLLPWLAHKRYLKQEERRLRWESMQ